MARKSRIDYAGARYHVINRGVEVSALEQSSESSFASLWYPSRRSAYESPELALEFAGGLADSRVGRRKYREYLDWLTQSDSEKSGLKGEGWKVDLARHLREAHLVPYRWITENLQMGAPSYVQSLVSRHRKKPASKEWRLLKNMENWTDPISGPHL